MFALLWAVTWDRSYIIYMALQIYNTLTRQKEEFKPLHPPKVTLYVCGVTVYDDCHLGHARALVSFDVIYRYLVFKGYDVTFVRNYTDVDDKIIDRAKKEGTTWDTIAKKYIRSFDEDMKTLGTRPPTIQPKATENMEEIINLVQGLVDKGYAYQAGGDVFYSVRKKKDYGKLSGKNIDELESGSRVEIHEAKKDPLDFALWKASKPGEPSWDSPWGPGRPGWHIECSAMSMRYLGDSFDIHGGGRDLAFPHHENEIAQSEAFSGKPFVKYWIHNGFVNIESEKMSKSLGNVLNLKALLNQFGSEVVRLFVLSAHYRSPLDYTEGLMVAHRQSLNRWYAALLRIQTRPGGEGDKGNLEKKVGNLLPDFESGMDDDFNSARVVGLLFDLLRDWNRVLDESGNGDREVSESFLKAVQKIHDVFGVFGSDPATYLKKEAARVLAEAELSGEMIEGRIIERKEARVAKDWKKADAIRQDLSALGIFLKDHPDGSTTWGIV